MPPRLKVFLQRWAITTVAVVIAEWIVPGIRCGAWVALLVATLILGMLNVVLRPLLVVASVAMMAVLNVIIGARIALLTLPFQIGFFGFLLLTINAGLLLGVAAIVPSFEVASFWAAFWGGVVISVITVFLNSLTGGGNAWITVRRGDGRPDRRRFRDRDGDGRDGPEPPGGGPVIDV